MALRIYWSPEAKARFQEIIDYLVEKWGDGSRRTFIRKVDVFLSILHNYPKLGKMVNKERNIRAFVIVKQITIFYQVKQDAIVLLNFYDNRQGPDKIPYK